MKLRERMKEKVNLSSTYLFIILILLLGLSLNLVNRYMTEGLSVDEANTLLFASGNWSSYCDMVEIKSPPLLTKAIAADWKQYMMNSDYINSFGNIWKDSAVDVHPPLFYIVLQSCFLIFGQSLIVAQLTNVLIYILSAVIFFFLAQVLFERKHAFLALLLFCVTPASFAVTGEIRSYALIGLFNITALFAIIKIINGYIGWKWWFVWIMSSLAALYTQYTYALIFASTSAYLLLYCLKRENWFLLIRYLKIMVLFVILLIPLMVLFWQQKSVAHNLGWLSDKWAWANNTPATMIWIFFETVTGSMKGIIFGLPVWFNLILGVTIYGSSFYFLTRLKYINDICLLSILLFVTTIFYAVLYQFGAIPSHAIGAKYQVTAVPLILITIVCIITVFKKKSWEFCSVILIATLMFLGSTYLIWKNYKARDHTISTYSMAKLVPKADLVILDHTFSGLVGPVIFALPEDQRILIGSQKDLLSKIDFKNEVIDEKSVMYISATKYNELGLREEITNRLLKAFDLNPSSPLEPIARLSCRGAGSGYSIFYFNKDS